MKITAIRDIVVPIRSEIRNAWISFSEMTASAVAIHTDAQRDGKPATLTYTTRNWQLKVFAQNVPYHDAVQETIRELTLNFKIQEDISGIQTSASISRALSMLVDGIGFTINDFNTFIPGSPANSFVDPSTGGGPATLIQNSPTPNPATAATGPPATGIPATGNVTNFFSGLIPGL